MLLFQIARRVIQARLLLAVVAVLSGGLNLAVQGAPAAVKAELVYRTPAGVVYHVTADGLSSITTGNRTLASGGWSCFNAEGWFKDSGSQEVKTDHIGDKALTVLGDRVARVRQVRGDVVCNADYSFEGDDLTISARVENNHATAPMNVTGFSGLTFHFDRPPAGLMQVQHISYFQAHGVGLCHPGYWSPIGGSYAADNSIGVGLSPWNTGLMRTLILWDYADWNPDKREKLPERKLIYFAVSPVPPRGAATFDFRMRISPNRDWKYLLEPYRRHFQRTFGPVQYKADDRWVATDYLNQSQQAISPTNPYGFHGGTRRIDTAAGVAAFCGQVIPALQQANGQGVIVWGQGGDDPRGAMYRPDFDVLPPEVEANWTTLAGCFKAAGLKLGVATRPRDMAVRLDWKQDQIIGINPDDAGHRDMLWRRFRNMKDKGCTLFYLDSFGDSFEDVKMMQFLREKLGPDVLTFAEHQCDAMMAFSGGYSEATMDADPKNGPPHYRLWSGVDNWRVYEWLAPGAQMAARLYEIKGKAPAGFESSDHFFLSHRITPLVPTNDFARAPEIRQLQGQFLTPAGQWLAP